jgi:hypothetical protein
LAKSIGAIGIVYGYVGSKINLSYLIGELPPVGEQSSRPTPRKIFKLACEIPLKDGIALNASTARRK